MLFFSEVMMAVKSDLVFVCVCYEVAHADCQDSTNRIEQGKVRLIERGNLKSKHRGWPVSR